MDIYLQSFFSEPITSPFSIARFQPDGFTYPAIDIFKPYTQSRNPITSKDPNIFLEAYCMLILRNFKEIERWLLMTIEHNENLTLCCWCNPTRRTYQGKLLCHSILVGYTLENIAKVHNKTLHIIYLDGRENPVWTRKDMNKQIQALLK
jgi:hypothetical protein